MVVMWFTAKAGRAGVAFGRSEKVLSHSVEASSVALEDGVSVMHTAVLKLLAARDTYYYRCGSEEDGWSPVYHFVREGETMPDIETVTFITYGDMGVHFAKSHTVLEAIQREDMSSIDFVFHAGDLAYAFKNMTRWAVFLSRIQPIAAQIPYLVCLGNRDDLPDVEKR
jgi:acid phosphatase type 7